MANDAPRKLEASFVEKENLIEDKELKRNWVSR